MADLVSVRLKLHVCCCRGVDARQHINREFLL